MKDQVSGLISELDDAWSEHCAYLVQEMQIDVPVVDNDVDGIISKIKEALRPTQYPSAKKNKKNKNWKVPLSGGVTNSSSNVIKIIPDKKKLQKSEVKLEHLATEKDVLTFAVAIVQEEKTRETEYSLIDYAICSHGNTRPCEICEMCQHGYCD